MAYGSGMSILGAAVDAVAKPINALTGVSPTPHALRYLGHDATATGRYFMRHRRTAKSQAPRSADPAEWFTFSQAYFGVGPVQRPSEIFALLRRAGDNGTRVICEIGAHDAGTSVLFSQAVPGVDALIVMDLYVKNRWLLRDLAPPGQAVEAVDGDSSHSRTCHRLQRKLGGRAIDLLLIDGDHEYEGVRHDFLTYRHMVRPGGLIAFHDIMPVRDSGLNRWVGGVPEFWSAVKERYRHEEYVDEPDQQGLGIGVLHYDPAASTDGL